MSNLIFESPCVWIGLVELIGENQRVFGPVAHGRCTLAAQSLKFSCAGTGDDRVGLLRHAILECADTLKRETPGFSADAPNDSLDTDE